MYLNCLAQTDRQRRAYYKSLNALRDRVFQGYAMKRIRKAVNSEIDAILDALSKARSFSEAESYAKNAILSNNDAWRYAIEKTYEDIGISNGKRVIREIEAISKGIGKDFEDVFLKKLPKHIKKVTAPKLKKLNLTSFKSIANDIQRAIDDGTSIDDLADYIRNDIPRTYKNRERAIARTETCEAQGYSGREAALYTGLEMEKSWLAWIDDKTRTGHALYNGETTPMDEPYIIDGDEMMYPGDSTMGAGAGNLVNCRCTETYKVI